MFTATKRLHPLPQNCANISSKMTKHDQIHTLVSVYVRINIKAHDFATLLTVCYKLDVIVLLCIIDLAVTIYQMLRATTN